MRVKINIRNQSLAQRTSRLIRIVLTCLLAVSVFQGLFSSRAVAQAITNTINVGEGPSSVGVNQETDKIYVTNAIDGTVSVVGSDYKVITNLTVGRNPFDVGINDKLNKVYVVNVDDSTVSVIDGGTNTIINTIIVGASPSHIAVNSNTMKAYVTNSDANTVSVINCLTDTVTKAVSVGKDPSGVDVNSKTDKVYVSNAADYSVSVIDGASDTVSGTLKLAGRTGGLAVNDVTNRVYVAGGSEDEDLISVIDGDGNTLRSQFSINCRASYDMAVNPSTNTVYVPSATSDTLAVIDGAKDSLRSSISVGDYPCSLGISMARDSVYVPNYYDNNVSIVVDPLTPTFYFAEGTCRPSFDPYICVQNTSMDEADVAITYFLGDATTKGQAIKVAPLSRYTIHPSEVLGTADDPAHDFSAKVECTNGQKIVAERPMYFNYGGSWTGGHDAIGATGSSITAYFAEGSTRPGFEPYVCIQNPNNEGTWVRIRLGPDTYHEVMMAPHSRTTLACSQLIEPGTDFYITAESITYRGAIRQPVIVERPMYFNYNGTWTGGSDIVGPPSLSTVFYFAEGTTRPNFDSFICMAAPKSPAQVKLTFMLGDGTTREHAVDFGARTTVNCRDILGTGDDAAHDFSVKVESTNGQPIVAERPMYFNYKGAWTGGHDVLGTSSPSKTFYFAEGSTRPNFETYFCIQNPESETAQVKITYMKGDGTTQEQNVEVGAHSRSTVACHDLLGNIDDLAHDFSAKVECTNGKEIVVERPMYFNYKGVWTGGHNVMGYQE